MRYLFISLLFFSIGMANAQDTITKRNGQKIAAKILEVSPADIKYKRFDYQEGPLYIEKRSEIASIVYSDGSKDVFELQPPPAVPASGNDYYGGTPNSNHIDLWTYKRYEQRGHYLDERQMHQLMLNTQDRKLMNLVDDSKGAKRGQLIGFVGIPFAVAAYGLLLASTFDMGYNSGPDPAFLTGSGACLLVAIACPIASHQFRKKRITADKAMVRLYNEKY